MTRVYATCRIGIARREQAGDSVLRERMSREDFKGAAYAVAVFMETAKAEIAADRAAGKPRGARILWARANPAKMTMGWFRRRLLGGQFRQR
jgi:hypothetical protein